MSCVRAPGHTDELHFMVPPKPRHSVLAFDENCAEPKEHIKHYGALRKTVPFVDILEEYIKLGQSRRLQGEVNI